MRVLMTSFTASAQSFACFAFMHLGIDIKSCEELVERGSGSMHHESIVDALMWDVAVLSLDVGILLMDHGRHGETGLLLMDRLADENAGVFGPRSRRSGLQSFIIGMNSS